MSASSELEGIWDSIEDTVSENRDSEQLDVEALYEELSFATELEEKAFNFDSHQYISELSMAMASADAKGFKHHDRGDFDTATLYFFAKDANMWESKVENGEIAPEDIFEASKAYADSLAAKDDWEWANLPEEQKKQLLDTDINKVEEELGRSWSYYKGLSSREVHEELDKAEKDGLRVGDVSTELFLEEGEVEGVKGIIDRYWQDLNEEETLENDVEDELKDRFDVEGVKKYWRNLKQDEEGEELMQEYSNQRAESLNFGSKSKALYDETWWIPHKTASDYTTPCEVSRNAEMYEATGEEDFLHLAEMPGKDKIEKFEHNPKDFETEGQGHAGIVSKFYLSSVEAHDAKGFHGLQMMRAAASKYYRATLTSHFTNQFDFNSSSIASFAHLDQIPIKKEEKVQKWIQNMNKDNK